MEVEEDEVVDEKGWVRKKVKKVIHPRSLYDGEKWKVPDAIRPFRVSAHHLRSVLALHSFTARKDGSMLMIW